MTKQSIKAPGPLVFFSGQTPFTQLNTVEVEDFIVRAGKLEQPKACPEELYVLITCSDAKDFTFPTRPLQMFDTSLCIMR